MSFGRRRSGEAFRIDAESLSWIYERTATQMTGFFARRLADRSHALDLTAETFALAFAGRRRFRGRTAAEAEGWVWGIARNLLLKHIRDGAVETRAVRRLGISLSRLSEDELDRVVELSDAAERRDELVAQLDALPADQREAVRMRILEDLEYPEMAERLGVSEQTIRARVSRALRRMAIALEDEN